MFQRSHWIQRVEAAWERRPIVWLAGVRRSGKTCLAKMLPEVEYFDCELPRVRRQMEDPEDFLARTSGKRLVLDEIHRLPDPTELLKIAADHFPDTRIVATGSSMLEASARFRDTLTGRKLSIALTPMVHQDLLDFQNPDLRHRLVAGGLPPFFLTREPSEDEYQEWLDSYWARDIQALFRLERRHAFLRLAELLFQQSGGIFEASRFAAPCEISRPTVTNYLGAMEATRVIRVLRPYSTRRATEIVSSPRTYAFDTGFVRAVRGWRELRPEDWGILWEHLVLDQLEASAPDASLRFWRTKHGQEVDFVLLRPGRPPLAIECKWSVRHAEFEGLKAFRRAYPEGENWLVTADAGTPAGIGPPELLAECIGLGELDRRLCSRDR